MQLALAKQQEPKGVHTVVIHSVPNPANAAPSSPHVDAETSIHSPSPDTSVPSTQHAPKHGSSKQETASP